MSNTVFNVLPINADESLACYLLRLATQESVSGIRGLVGHMHMGVSNASLNKHIQQLAKLTLQSLVDLKASRVCPEPAHRTLREKYARFTTNPFCPHCVRESGYFKRQWRHGLVAACPTHKCELVDTCPSCFKTIDHTRAHAFYCDCGQDLTAIEASPASPECIWVSARIAGEDSIESDLPTFGNTKDSDWETIDELLFLFGSYFNQEEGSVRQPRLNGKFHSVRDTVQFLENAVQCLRNFPEGFEEDVKKRLEQGDKTKAGLANRLGPPLSE